MIREIVTPRKGSKEPVKRAFFDVSLLALVPYSVESALILAEAIINSLQEVTLFLELFAPLFQVVTIAAQVLHFVRVLRALNALSLHNLVEDGLEAQGSNQP